MSKPKLTKGSLSLGGIEKKAMPALKSDLSANEQQTSIYLNSEVYKAARQYAMQNDMSFKQYVNELIRTDLEQKGLI
ncbi:hypothetical protein HW40_07685 [Mannheimia haemolytica]|uniref:hypothetical protein n=1 Tax=Pasteurellaceae TaxID=712 RepID=UPI0005C89C5A|nr:MULTISPECIES: hypothetical protein [Pasteurellaceae]KIX30664.1 hypothetical protein HW40_07685 [Mannheimia haemolytica]MDA5614061.1 hypothetical protein [Pasteurella multocida]MDA5621728.1 hypothetical protein [Pasteurella multocida subsp. multocida]